VAQLSTLGVSMRKSFVMRWVGCLAVVFCAIALVSCRSLAYVHRAPEDHQQLWMGVLKPFGGPVYYVGSDGDYSYFRGHGLFCDRYKARTSELHLPRTFPFGKQKAYVVTLDMVPEY
jgi:hypothetical protein